MPTCEALTANNRLVADEEEEDATPEAASHPASVARITTTTTMSTPIVPTTPNTPKSNRYKSLLRSQTHKPWQQDSPWPARNARTVVSPWSATPQSRGRAAGHGGSSNGSSSSGSSSGRSRSSSPISSCSRSRSSSPTTTTEELGLQLSKSGPSFCPFEQPHGVVTSWKSKREQPATPAPTGTAEKTPTTSLSTLTPRRGYSTNPEKADLEFGFSSRTSLECETKNPNFPDLNHDKKGRTLSNDEPIRIEKTLYSEDDSDGDSDDDSGDDSDDHEDHDESKACWSSIAKQPKMSHEHVGVREEENLMTAHEAQTSRIGVSKTETLKSCRLMEEKTGELKDRLDEYEDWLINREKSIRQLDADDQQRHRELEQLRVKVQRLQQPSSSSTRLSDCTTSSTVSSSSQTGESETEENDMCALSSRQPSEREQEHPPMVMVVVEEEEEFQSPPQIRERTISAVTSRDGNCNDGDSNNQDKEQAIPWKKLEEAFAPLYGKTGRAVADNSTDNKTKISNRHGHMELVENLESGFASRVSPVRQIWTTEHVVPSKDDEERDEEDDKDGKSVKCSSDRGSQQQDKSNGKEEDNERDSENQAAPTPIVLGSEAMTCNDDSSGSELVLVPRDNAEFGQECSCSEQLKVGVACEGVLGTMQNDMDPRIGNVASGEQEESNLTEEETKIAIKYKKMLSLGVPIEAVQHKMIQDHVASKIVDFVFPKSAKEGSGVSDKLTDCEEEIAQRYRKMLKIGLQKEVVRHQMMKDQVAEKVLLAVLGTPELPESMEETNQAEKVVHVKTNSTELSESERSLAQEYKRLLKLQIPRSQLESRMRHEGVSNKVIAFVLGTKSGSNNEDKQSSSNAQGSKLVSLHWTPLSSDQIENSVWKAAKAMKIEEDADLSKLVELFQKKTTSSNLKSGGAESSLSGLAAARLVDINRSNNVAISLKAFKDFTYEEISDIIMFLDPCRKLQGERVSFLRDLLPTQIEIKAVKDYTGPVERLVPAEKWFRQIMNIKRIEVKVRVLRTMETFDVEARDVGENLSLFTRVCNQIMDSKKLQELLAMVLLIGNLLNEGTRSGRAAGFKFDSLLKLTQTKSTDGRTTALDYIVALYAGKGKRDTLNIIADFPECQTACRMLLSDLVAEVKSIQESLEQCKAELEALKQDSSLDQRDAKFGALENDASRGNGHVLDPGSLPNLKATTQKNSAGDDDSRQDPNDLVDEQTTKPQQTPLPNRTEGDGESSGMPPVFNEISCIESSETNSIYAAIGRLERFTESADVAVADLYTLRSEAVRAAQELSKFGGEGQNIGAASALLQVIFQFATSLDSALKKYDEKSANKTNRKKRKSGGVDSDSKEESRSLTSPDASKEDDPLMLLVNQMLEEANETAKVDFRKGRFMDNRSAELEAVYARERQLIQPSVERCRRDKSNVFDEETQNGDQGRAQRVRSRPWNTNATKPERMYTSRRGSMCSRRTEHYARSENTSWQNLDDEDNGSSRLMFASMKLRGPCPEPRRLVRKQPPKAESSTVSDGDIGPNDTATTAGECPSFETPEIADQPTGVDSTTISQNNEQIMRNRKQKARSNHRNIYQERNDNDDSENSGACAISDDNSEETGDDDEKASAALNTEAIARKKFRTCDAPELYLEAREVALDVFKPRQGEESRWCCSFPWTVNRIPSPTQEHEHGPVEEGYQREQTKSIPGSTLIAEGTDGSQNDTTLLPYLSPPLVDVSVILEEGVNEAKDEAVATHAIKQETVLEDGVNEAKDDDVAMHAIEQETDRMKEESRTQRTQISSGKQDEMHPTCATRKTETTTLSLKKSHVMETALVEGPAGAPRKNETWELCLVEPVLTEKIHPTRPTEQVAENKPATAFPFKQENDELSIRSSSSTLESTTRSDDNGDDSNIEIPHDIRDDEEDIPQDIQEATLPCNTNAGPGLDFGVSFDCNGAKGDKDAGNDTTAHEEEIQQYAHAATLQCESADSDTKLGGINRCGFKKSKPTPTGSAPPKHQRDAPRYVRGLRRMFKKKSTMPASNSQA